MAIQAVNEKLHALETARDLAGDDFFEAIMAYGAAAHDLKEAYEQAQRMASNLPPYETLVAKTTS